MNESGGCEVSQQYMFRSLDLETTAIKNRDLPCCGAGSAGAIGPRRTWPLSKIRMVTVTLLAAFMLGYVMLQLMYSGAIIRNSLCVGNNSQCNFEMINQYDEENDRLRFPRTKRRLPQCVIIGVRKGGTRALLEFLNLHPRIQKAGEEIHFFDNDERYALGLEWYRRRMPYSFPNQITIEKSPAYFITRNVPERIYAMNNSIKLLLIVREPVTRVISDYAQRVSNQEEKGLLHSRFRDLVLDQNGEVDTSYKAIRVSVYQKYLANWLRVFRREQIHIVDGDRLIEEPVAEIQLVEQFLGIENRVTSENFYYNQTKGFYCVRNETQEKCLSSTKGRKHPDVDADVIKKLREFYHSHNLKFYQMAGRDFGWP